MDTTHAAVTCQVPVFFATTEGQTRKIAEYIAAVLRDQGFDSRAIAVAAPEAARLDWSGVRAVALGASLHRGTHQPEAAAFVRAHAARLNARPSAFFSVSLSAASTRPEESAAARQLATAFPAAHGWAPARIACIAGRLAYTQYGFFTRLVLKRIARKEGAPTDTSRDYELTDWNVADDLAAHLVTAIRGLTRDEGRRSTARPRPAPAGQVRRETHDRHPPTTVFAP
jgi:menaquinone-dependent protoporphyrinogen oxidase